MKTIYKVLISFGVGICLIFVGVSLGGLQELPQIGFFDTLNFKWHHKSIDDIEFHSERLADEIEINVHKGNVQFYEKDSIENIEIQAYDIYNGFEIYQKGDKLIIDQPHYLWFGEYADAQIKVYVPVAYEFDKAKVNMSAGYLKVSGLKAEKIEANSAAGRLDLNSMICDKFDIDGGFGQTNVKYLTCRDKLDVNLGMGDVNVMLTGLQDEYNYSVDVGFGHVKIGDDEFSFIGDQKMNRGTTSQLIDVDCGFGSVKIEMED